MSSRTWLYASSSRFSSPLRTGRRLLPTSIDLFTVPSATFQILFVFVVLAPDRRRVAGFQVTGVLIAPRSRGQNPYVERLIGSVRSECLDHVIVFSEAHLRRFLSVYIAYYQRSRTHLSLNKDAPDARDVQLPAMGKVVELPRSADSTTATSGPPPEPAPS